MERSPALIKLGSGGAKEEEKPRMALVDALDDWFFGQDCFHDAVAAFAERHEAALTPRPGGDFAHDLHAAHAAFSAEFEGAVSDFLAAQGATMADLEVG